MLATRLLTLALVVAGASALALDGNKEDRETDFDNEVLPQNDGVRARVDDVTSNSPPSKNANPEPPMPPVPSSTSGPAAGSPSSADTADAVTPTSVPPRTPSGLSKFLSDIIQIPIAALRAVGSLLSNTFSGRHPGSTTANNNTGSPAAA